MKASIVGELLLLVGVLAVAYFVYVQQSQLVELELELDRMRGAIGATLPPVPLAEDGAAAAARPKATRKRGASGGS